MSATAWHYEAGEAKGTLVGEGLEREEDARRFIAQQHGVKPEEVSMRKAGDDRLQTMPALENILVNDSRVMDAGENDAVDRDLRQGSLFD